MQKVTPFLWFDDQAEEAANFYVSLFKHSKILGISRYEGEAAKPGSVTVVSFELDGQSFTALNGGPAFRSTEAISFVVNCETQEELDFFWENLGSGGTPGQCGWLKDRYGVSWQIVPTVMDELMSGDTEKAKRVMGAMLRMTKIEIKGLQAAYEIA